MKTLIGPVIRQLAKSLAKSLAALATTAALGLSATPAAFADGYAVRAGDTLKIEVLEDNTLNRAVLVDPKGAIALPEAGSIPVAGQSVDAIAAAITAKIGASFATPPHVYVALQQVAVPVAGGAGSGKLVDVYVVGEANKLGKFSVKSGTTALQAFAEMGGFTKFAATKRIQIRHTDAKTGAASTTKLNYDAIEAGTSSDGAMTLQAGDVIIVPQRHLFE